MSWHRGTGEHSSRRGTQMKMGIRSLALVVVTIAAMTPAQAQQRSDTWDLLAEKARAQGVDANWLGAQKLTLRLGDEARTLTIRDWVEQFGPSAQVGPPVPANVNVG